MGRIKPSEHCASPPEIGIPIDAGVGESYWPNRQCILILIDTEQCGN
jgi:hypothetical protein